MAGKGKKNSRAWTYSDRSGMQFPTNEMVVEPGTGYWVHKSESDGEYNAVTHPQARVTKHIKYDDPKPVKNARSSIDYSVSDELLAEYPLP